MNTIYKYPLKRTDIQTLELTDRAQILSVQLQGGELTLWARLNTHDMKTICTIYIIGTGHDIPYEVSLFYITTVMDGDYVWHIFKLND